MTMITFSCLERKNCLKIPTRFLKSSACRQRNYLMRKLKILESWISTKSCWRPNQPVCTFVDIWHCYLKTMNCHVSWSCISNQSKGLTQWLHTVKLRLHSIVGEVRMRVPPDLWKWSKRQPWIFLCKDLWEWKRVTSRVQLNHTNKKIKTWFCIKPTRCYHLRWAADVATTGDMFCVKCCHFYLFLAFLKK